MPDYLADTNIWLRLAEPSHPMFAAADHALQKIEGGLDDVFLTPQVISEYWRVATSEGSQRGGFGWDVTRTDLAVQALEASYTMLDDSSAVYGR